MWSPAIEDGLGRVRRGGTFQQFGVAAADATATFSPFRVYNDELTITGSMAVLNSYGRAVEMFTAGALNAEAMVSHAFCLDDYGEALEMFRSGSGRKAADQAPSRRLGGTLVALSGECTRQTMLTRP